MKTRTMLKRPKCPSCKHGMARYGIFHWICGPCDIVILVKHSDLFMRVS